MVPDDQVRLGDAYWSLAEAYAGVERRQLRSHAGFWYQQAEAELTGLTQTRVASRLASIEPASGTAASSAADRPANLTGIWESSNEGMVVQLHDDGTTIRIELLKADKLARLDAYFICAGDRFIVKQWAGAFRPDFDSSGETRSCRAVVLAIDDEHLRVMTDKFWIDSGEITRKSARWERGTSGRSSAKRRRRNRALRVDGARPSQLLTKLREHRVHIRGRQFAPVMGGYATLDFRCPGRGDLGRRKSAAA